MKWQGTFEQLQATVHSLGLSGDWADIANGKQFKGKDGAILNWYSSSGTLQFQGKQAAREALQKALSSAVPETGGYSSPAVGGTQATEAPQEERVFVVHGHDQTAREQLELILHKLGLDPFVLANTGGGGLTIIEALENEIGPAPGRARFGIVLMTPDDVGYAKADGPQKAEPRARQNVVLEMGMLIAALGRPNVAILKKGHLEVPSDAQGIVYLSFNDLSRRRFQSSSIVFALLDSHWSRSKSLRRQRERRGDNNQMHRTSAAQAMDTPRRSGCCADHWKRDL